MKATRISVLIGNEALTNIVDAGTHPSHGRSQRLNELISRFTGIVESLTPPLDSQFENEMPALLDAYVAHGSSRSGWLDGFAAEILDSAIDNAFMRDEVTDEKAIIAANSFLKNFSELSIHQRLALEEIIALRFYELTHLHRTHEVPSPEVVKQSRLAAGITQSEAAQIAGVNERYWRAWESGEREVDKDTWAQIAAEMRDAASLIEIDRASTKNKPRVRG